MPALLGFCLLVAGLGCLDASALTPMPQLPRRILPV